jgi:hypothetical protein
LHLEVEPLVLRRHLTLFESTKNLALDANVIVKTGEMPGWELDVHHRA